MNKRKLLITGVAVIALVTLFGFISSYLGPNKEVIDNANIDSGKTTYSPFEGQSQDKNGQETGIEKEKLSISYLNPAEEKSSDVPSGKEVPTNEVVNISTDEYRISYFPDEDLYSISILKSPFEIYREKAEDAFLKELDLKEFEACKLNVTISAPRFVDSEVSVKSLKLSFCVQN